MFKNAKKILAYTNLNTINSQKIIYLLDDTKYNYIIIVFIRNIFRNFKIIINLKY
jgi:hypothetical protein